MMKLDLNHSIRQLDELNKACDKSEDICLPIDIPPFIAFDGKTGQDYARKSEIIDDLPNSKLRLLATAAAAKVFGIEKIEYGVPIYQTMGLTKTEAFEVCRNGKMWILSKGADVKLSLFWRQATDPYPSNAPAENL